ncbi:MAG: hypothetical protein Q8P67_13400 [archaeon]|nr:hypothetical protein [archaeon]
MMSPAFAPGVDDLCRLVPEHPNDGKRGRAELWDALPTISRK